MNVPFTMIMVPIRSRLHGSALFTLTLALAHSLAAGQTAGGPAASPAGDPGLGGDPLRPSPWIAAGTNSDGSLLTLTETSDVTVLAPPIELHPHFRITEDGVVGEGGSFRIAAEGNLLATPIHIQGPTGQDLRLRVAAIAASDSRTGRRIWLGTLREGQGVVLDGEPARIAWTNTFDGITADILVVYNINSVIHDVYLREPVRIPEDAGFSPASTRIEIWTEIFAGPEPRQTPRPISLVAADPANPKAPLLPDKQAQDTDLDWGGMKMIPGCAFRVNAADAARENWPVAKQWITQDHRRFLVETVDFESVKPAFDGLKTARLPVPDARRPMGQATPSYASAARGSSPSAPPPAPVATGSKALLAQWDRRQTAAWNETPGMEIDWSLVNNLLMNIDLGGTATKTGPAALGKSTNDYWNLYHVPGSYDSTITNLLYSDGTASSVTVRVRWLKQEHGGYERGLMTGDVMFDTHLWSDSYIWVTVGGLPTGSYTIYVYGRGSGYYDVGVFTLNGITKRTNPGYYGDNNQLAGGGFLADNHYVIFDGVPITNTVPLLFTVSWAGGSGYTFISGIQIAAMPNLPPSVNAGVNQSVTFPNAATLQGSASDDGIPAGSLINLAWSKLSGPGDVAFSPATGTGGSITSYATFSTNGVYALRLTASDGNRSATSDMNVSVNMPLSGDFVWVEDALPAGAIGYSEGDPWSWINANPIPYSGSLAHQSAICAEFHQHRFTGATTPVPIQAADILYSYVYLDPANPPQQVMLRWVDIHGYWFSAYWGADHIGLPGVAMSNSVPASGSWIRLEVPAATLGMGGQEHWLHGLHPVWRSRHVGSGRRHAAGHPRSRQPRSPRQRRSRPAGTPFQRCALERLEHRRWPPGRRLPHLRLEQDQRPGHRDLRQRGQRLDDRLLQYEWPISPAPGRQRQPVDRV